MKFDVFVDPSSLQKVLDSLDGKEIPQAISGASNATLRSMKTFSVKLVREELPLKAGDVRPLMTVRRGSPSNPGGSLRISRQPVPLVKYGARQTKYGVTVAVRKGKGREKIPHTFLATMHSGHRGVWIRAELAKGRTGPTTIKTKLKRLGITLGLTKKKHGLPIVELYGPTVVGVIAGKPGMKKRIEDFAAYAMAKNFESQISRFKNIPNGPDETPAD